MEAYDSRSVARWVSWYVLAGLLGCMLVSASMWWPRLDLPLIPLWGSLEPFAPIASTVLMTGFLTLVLASVQWGERSWLLGISACCVVGLVTVDMLRLQPWVVHLTGLLLLWGFLKPVEDDEHAENFLWVASWILIFVYFWAGWHKFQPLFGANSLFLSFFWLPSSIQAAIPQPWLVPLGYGAAALEMLLALSLLFSQTRRVGVILLTVTHFSVVTSLLWMAHDVVVIPWNLTCLGLLWILFWNNDTSLWKISIPSGWRSVPVGLVFAFFVLMPALHTAERWDPNLSFALYTGNYPRAELVVPASTQQAFPASMKRYISQPKHDALGTTKQVRKASWAIVNLYQWSSQRFQTTAPPSLSFYRAALRVLCRTNPKARLRWRDTFSWYRARAQRKQHIETCR